MRFFIPAIVTLLLLTGCSRKRQTEQSEPQSANARATMPEPTATPNALPFPSTEGKPSFSEKGVTWYLLEEGKGATGQKGQKVTVHYTGWLKDGTKFDSSRDRNAPFTFNIGGKVIPGWNLLGQKLREGDRVFTEIPSDMAYGNRDLGIIPPNSTLMFDIKILEIE